MGRFIEGINGAIIGKVGTVVGSTWKGQPYVKSRPFRRAKKQEGEKRNQSNFATLHYWLQPVIRFLRQGFKGYSPTVEGFNAAKSVNLKNAFRLDGEMKVLDPQLVQVSWGNLALPENISVTRTAENQLQFNWDTSHNTKDANGSDQVMLLAYDDKDRRCMMKLFGQFRSAGSDILVIPTTKKRDYHVYVAFLAHDRSRQSNSMYLGFI